MFTGLVEGVGRVEQVEAKGPERVLTIAPPWEPGETVIGESIAVNGACLTVTEIGPRGFSVLVSAESLARTTLGRLQRGQAVNLERALKLGDRLGGHLVTGHVDCVGTVARITPVGASRRMYITIPPEHLRLVVAKGSVAVEGVSLTVNRLDRAGFELNLIPHTLAATTLSLVRVGDSVNIETDLIGKYVARLLNPDQDSEEGSGKGGLSREDLARAGF